MERRIWGYCSTADNTKNFDEQKKILHDTNLDFTLIFSDMHTEKKFDHEQYKNMIENLKSGDLVIFPSLTTLGHDYDQIVHEWNLITQTKNCDIKICDIDILDTSNIQDTTMVEHTNHLLIELLKYVSSLSQNKGWPYHHHIRDHKNSKAKSTHKSSYITWN